MYLTRMDPDRSTGHRGTDMPDFSPISVPRGTRSNDLRHAKAVAAGQEHTPIGDRQLIMARGPGRMERDWGLKIPVPAFIVPWMGME